MRGVFRMFTIRTGNPGRRPHRLPTFGRQTLSPLLQDLSRPPNEPVRPLAFDMPQLLLAIAKPCVSSTLLFERRCRSCSHLPTMPSPGNSLSRRDSLSPFGFPARPHGLEMTTVLAAIFSPVAGLNLIQLLAIAPSTYSEPCPSRTIEQDGREQSSNTTVWRPFHPAGSL
jgi:hypothetical protein